MGYGVQNKNSLSCMNQIPTYRHAVAELSEDQPGLCPPPTQKKTSLYTVVLGIFFNKKQLKIIMLALPQAHCPSMFLSQATPLQACIGSDMRSSNTLHVELPRHVGLRLVDEVSQIANPPNLHQCRLTKKQIMQHRLQDTPLFSHSFMHRNSCT